MLYKKLSFLLALIPAVTLATTATFDTNTLPALTAALNTSKASQCIRIMRACQNPKQSPVPDDTCVQRKVKANPSCEQLQVLADKLETSPALLNVTAVPNGFAIVRKSYPADGQFQYYIISPKGQIIDTAMDPRQYNPVLQLQYPNKDLIISNNDSVQFKGKTNKPMTFVATVKVSDGCLACSVLGYATSRFIFKKDGTLQGIRLVSFSKQANM